MKSNKSKIIVGISAALVLALGLFVFVQSGTVQAAALVCQGTPGGWAGYAGNNPGVGQITGNGQASGYEQSMGYGSMGGFGQRGYGLTTIGTSTTPLSDAEKDALQRAILEEYGALNLYQSVINQFGNIYPFSQIVLSEQQHVNALVTQATKYGVTVPENPGLQTTTTFASVTDACQAGVDAEIADAALYDELKPVMDHADIERVFTMLQNASLNSHLPAFQTCD